MTNLDTCRILALYASVAQAADRLPSTAATYAKTSGIRPVSSPSLSTRRSW